MSTPNMGLTLPVDHGSTDTWDVILDAVFGLIDSHDHSTGRGVKVPSAGLNINADLSFISHAITNALALDMVPTTTASVAAYSSAIFVNSADNNLYFRNAAGNNVQITAGNIINIAVAGAIGGDYGSVGALLDFVDANDTYHFFQQLGAGVRQYGKVAHADLDLFEYKAAPSAGVPANRVRHKSPASLAASYDLTWLAALPAANAGLSADSTGLITAGLSETYQANQSITLSGTGVYKHGTKTIGRVLSKFMFANVSTGSVADTAGAAGVSLANNTLAFYPLPDLPQHARLRAVTLWCPTAADRNNVGGQIFTTDSADPATTTFLSLGPTGLMSPSGTAKLSVAFTQTMSGSQVYVVQLGNGVNTPKITAITVDYDVP